MSSSLSRTFQPTALVASSPINSNRVRAEEPLWRGPESKSACPESSSIKDIRMTSPRKRREEPQGPPIDLPNISMKLPPAAEPWDKIRGHQYDVITEEKGREIKLAESATGHWAPNYGTFTRARARPIKRFRYPILLFDRTNTQKDCLGCRNHVEKCSKESLLILAWQSWLR